MFIALGRATTIAALLLSLGLHWFALQSVAWTTMLVSNATQVPLREAVARTFDGAHPCDLCHAVAAGKKSEKNSNVVPTVAKIDLFCTTPSVNCLPPWVSYTLPSFVCLIPEQPLAPPAPPPRALLA
jgi:hypothetical protein